MKILISGVAGFIGSALAKELLRREVQVVGAVRSGAVADRLLPGVFPALIETIDEKTDWSL